MMALGIAYRLTTTTTKTSLWRFHVHKEDLQFTVCDMFSLINAEMTKISTSEANARYSLGYLTLFVTCDVFLDENWTF